MRIYRLTIAVTSAVAMVTAACNQDDVSPGIPLVSNVSVTLNPNNSLSMMVSARVVNADSVRASYLSANEAQRFTPYYPVHGETVTLAVLGLLPNTTYALALQAYGGGATVLSNPSSASTGELPDALKSVSLVSTGTPEPGYLLVPLGVLGAVAFDHSGRIVWYRAFPLGTGERVDETAQQPNGDFTTYVGTTSGWQADTGRFYEYTPNGEIVRVFRAGGGLYTDEHELLLTGTSQGDMRAHLFGYDLRTVDQSSIGGPSNSLVAGHALLRMALDGHAEFQWSAWDHFPVEQWAGPTQTDFDHTNALTFDLDGNYVVSVRNLSEVDKIDAQTGQFIWRFGGKNGQFAIRNDPDGGPSLQHAVRVLSNGHLLMYDNGVDHTPQESRAVEYALDLTAMTATLVWQYRHTPAIYTPIVGYVQRFGNQKTLVAFGWAGVVNEVNPDGTVAWEGAVKVNGQTTTFYRARRIPSLYQYQTP